MTWGLIEREIRLLPQVLSCSVSDDEIVVLVHPEADPTAVEARVAQVLGESRANLATRVIGGMEPLRVAATRRAWRSPLVLAGSVAATGLLAVSSLVGGLGSAGDRATPPAPVIAGPVPPAPSLFPRNPGPPAAAPQDQPDDEEEPSVTGPVIRVLQPRLVAALTEERPVPAETEAPTVAPKPAAPVPASPPAEPPSSTTCHEPAARGAPREMRGRHKGSGPPPWSHSVLADPHCTRGRPR